MATRNDNEATALAFDFGQRRIGVAFANRVSGSSSALTTLTTRDREELERSLRDLFEEWEPGAIVIGVPYNMDGTESEMTTAAIGFANRLAERFGLPVEQVDERLTSAEARAILRTQRESGERRRKTRAGDIDSIAAQLIGESWLRGDA
ncbi:MAG: Holliday junction resolvase RuvX [Gammaproteobacteria bacterium]|nr:Holliday junction resolvase RuvX [Gammaproteobacteria bacterium]MBT8445003.1 Holliday junction resolvase RuvX [Gammaproteobacteria bacterium]